MERNWTEFATIGIKGLMISGIDPIQLSHIMSTEYSGSTLGSPASWTGLKSLPIARRHPGQMAEPHQLAIPDHF